MTDGKNAKSTRDVAPKEPPRARGSKRKLEGDADGIDDAIERLAVPLPGEAVLVKASRVAGLDRHGRWRIDGPGRLLRGGLRAHSGRLRHSSRWGLIPWNSKTSVTCCWPSSCASA